MRLRQNKCKGYSIVEMILATGLVISLSAVSYRVLKTLTLKQSTNVAGQKTSKAAQVALDRFRNDMSMVDYNWVRYGVASIYPHPGFAFDQNFYADGSIRHSEKVNDGISFLRRDPTNDKIYDTDEHKRLCYPVAQTSQDLDLYGNTLAMPSTDGLHEDDWVLIYQAGKYAVGMIQRVESDAVVIFPPPQTTLQKIALNRNSQLSGYVGRAGLVPANMDFDRSLTPMNSDDSFCFDIKAARIQKIANPVSYFVDYRTTDGDEKNATNSYMLDKNGDQIKMLVRMEYKKAATKREYIASVDQVEFTYDILTDDETMVGGVNRDIGHDYVPETLQMLANTDPDHTDATFESTNKIVAVKMNLRLANEGKETGEKDWNQAQEIKIALDPSLQQDMYQQDMKVTSTRTANLNTIPSTKGGTSIYSEQLGKPLYISSGAGEEIMIPVSTFELDQYGNMGPSSDGKIYVYNAAEGQEGCPIHDDGSCGTPHGDSVISFTPGNGQTFFPNTLNQIFYADGSSRIVVGGVGMDMTNVTATRKPMLATIDLASGETLKEKLANQISGVCNISNCNVQVIDNTQPGLEDLVDTANISIDQSRGEIYVATMTKNDGSSSGGEDSKAKIYKGQWNGTEFQYSKFADVDDSDEGRIVSAVSDRLIEAGGSKYLPVCLTKKINAACNGECLNDTNGANPDIGDPNHKDVYGRIELIKNANEKIILMRHNYRCSSISVDNNNNLIVAGRLTAQPITNEEIKNALTDPSYLAELQKEVLYLDEVGKVDQGQPYYADYFKIDPATYDLTDTSSQGVEDIGWLTGMSTVQRSDGTFAVVNANKYRLDAGAVSGKTHNYDATPKEYSNAGIAKVSLAGMQDRVVATIETDQGNINASKITATYNAAISEIPPTYLPGAFYPSSASGTPRVTPTPLPSASPAMSDQSWIDLYRQMLSATGNQGLNQGMPMIGAFVAQPYNCKYSFPRCTVN